MNDPEPPRFVNYLRVSTDGQGRSGLGLEAYRAAVAAHAAGCGPIVAEHVEVESGRRKDRPQLAAALAACRSLRATLFIARLDRLARNVAFVSNLMESGVEFVAADMPVVNRLPSWKEGERHYETSGPLSKMPQPLARFRWEFGSTESAEEPKIQ